MKRSEYAMLLKESLDDRRSLKAAVSRPRRKGATTFDMVAAIRKVKGLTRPEAVNLFFKYAKGRDFEKTTKKYIHEFIKLRKQAGLSPKRRKNK